MAYGVCQNKYGAHPCEKALSKEIQIADKSNFVCSNPNCGKPLKEVPPPPVDQKERMKRFWKKNKNPIVVAFIMLALIVSGLLIWKSCSSTPSESKPNTQIVVTDSTEVPQKDTVNTKSGPTGIPPEGSRTKEATVFKGKATYDAKARKITVNATLTLTDSEGKTITLRKGDVIRGVAVQGGNTLTQGECVINGESKLFTGEVPF